MSVPIYLSTPSSAATVMVFLIITVRLAGLRSKIFGRNLARALIDDPSMLIIQRDGCDRNLLLGEVAGGVTAQKHSLALQLVGWLSQFGVLVHVNALLITRILIPLDALTCLA